MSSLTSVCSQHGGRLRNTPTVVHLYDYNTRSVTIQYLISTFISLFLFLEGFCIALNSWQKGINHFSGTQFYYGKPSPPYLPCQYQSTRSIVANLELTVVSYIANLNRLCSQQIQYTFHQRSTPRSEKLNFDRILKAHPEMLHNTQDGVRHDTQFAD